MWEHAFQGRFPDLSASQWWAVLPLLPCPLPGGERAAECLLGNFALFCTHAAGLGSQFQHLLSLLVRHCLLLHTVLSTSHIVVSHTPHPLGHKRTV
ncbi:unnamed protein product [Oncorhynchus mykiss]|uniref:Uncharacterized protein n=1 Tax=Oncorhynchus mykiss TaxID=8022 RepID=A0A060VYW2_ONCMY|nr:unnamed protein product [Oncorhynchus mykiss]